MISRIVLQWLWLGLLAVLPSPISSECGTRTVEKNSIITSLLIDGDTANPGEFPWLAGIWVNGRFSCTGNLVKDRYIITAANCVSYRRYYTTHVRRPEEVKVTLGSIRRTSADPDRTTIRASKIFTESAFRATKPFLANLAVITLASPVVTSHKISPICLPSNCSHEDEGDKECYTAGWGRTISYFATLPDYLLKTRQRVYPMSRCVAAGFPSGYDRTSQICVESTRTTTRNCYGDGGGGLVCRSSSGKWVLRGVFSSMLGSCTSDFSMYTRVCHYLDDILNIVDG